MPFTFCSSTRVGPDRASRAYEAKALAAIDTLTERLPPIGAIEIPTNGFFNAGLKSLMGAPSQLFLQPAGIDGIAPVVARAIGDEANKLVMGAIGGEQTIHPGTNLPNDIDILAFVASTDVVGVPWLASAENDTESARVIL